MVAARGRFGPASVGGQRFRTPGGCRRVAAGIGRRQHGRHYAAAEGGREGHRSDAPAGRLGLTLRLDVWAGSAVAAWRRPPVRRGRRWTGPVLPGGTGRTGGIGVAGRGHGFDRLARHVHRPKSQRVARPGRRDHRSAAVRPNAEPFGGICLICTGHRRPDPARAGVVESPSASGLAVRMGRSAGGAGCGLRFHDAGHRRPERGDLAGLDPSQSAGRDRCRTGPDHRYGQCADRSLVVALCPGAGEGGSAVLELDRLCRTPSGAVAGRVVALAGDGGRSARAGRAPGRGSAAAASPQASGPAIGSRRRRGRDSGSGTGDFDRLAGARLGADGLRGRAGRRHGAVDRARPVSAWWSTPARIPG